MPLLPRRQILCGDAPTFEDLYREMGSWYHLMASYTLYSRPWVGIFDLRSAAHRRTSPDNRSARDHAWVTIFEASRRLILLLFLLLTLFTTNVVGLSRIFTSL